MGGLDSLSRGARRVRGAVYVSAVAVMPYFRRLISTKQLADDLCVEESTLVGIERIDRQTFSIITEEPDADLRDVPPTERQHGQTAITERTSHG